jgi:cyclopropane-fatty-acyl-phospholipid synthase
MVTRASDFELRAPLERWAHGEAMTRRYKDAFRSLFAEATDPFAVRFWDGEEVRFGAGAPEFTVVVHSVRALASLDEDAIAESYFRGDWSIEGDASKAFGMRRYLSAKPAQVQALKLLARVLFVSGTRNNADAVADHYSYGDDFYLSFLDTRYRMYSHGHFHRDDESLEDAQENKLRTMYESLGLRPGMRLLDIGGGWGPANQYAGERGVEVTSLTVAQDSKHFIERLIRDRNLPCRVVQTDFLDFTPEKPFDAIVIFGVIEHIPQYRAFVDQVWRCLTPGGLMYLDASATRVKYRMNAAVRRSVWTSTATYLSLHDFMAELNYGGLQTLELKNESRDYEITMRHWARRFEANRDFIVSRWGDRVYRMFQLYLWGGHHCFRWDTLQAYRMIIRRPEARVADPGPIRRLMSVVYGAS